MLKKINNFTGYYISDDGKVYCNIAKGCRTDKGIIKYTNLKELKPRMAKNGYTRVYIRSDLDGKRKDIYIHRLVAEYFIPNPLNKKYVNHKNCKRDDNRVENLEWCTSKENNNQTLELKHVIRNEKGQFVSNFDYNKES